MGVTLRIGLVPFILTQIVGMMFYHAFTGSVFASPETLAASIQRVGIGAYYLGFLALLAVNIIILGWLAVNWHRFILLQEYPSGFMPRFWVDQTKSYVTKLILIMLLVMALAIPLGLVAGMIVVALNSLGPVALRLPIIALYSVIGWVVMRLSLVLPSVSIGKEMTFTEAWSETKEMAGSIFWVAVISGILTSAPGLLTFLAPNSVVFNFVISLVVGFVGIMMAASILTTLYGVIVEKRELT